jgi:hypothetical protein
VQSAGEDFEWYPTTTEIITALKRDLSYNISSDYHREKHAFLDIGAGNGKVLSAVAGVKDIGPLYAIEKSHTLINLMPNEILILGCDFWHTSLIDKDVRLIFSNPPYSLFEEWSVKIVREAPASATIYLVIPERWENSTVLEGEIKQREATRKIIGTFDFASAEDRRARAKVHLVRIQLKQLDRYEREDAAQDPFTRFFNETFKFTSPEADELPFEEKLADTQLVNRMNFIEALCHLYDARMSELHRNYQAICGIPTDILEEFDIQKPGLIKSLKMKLATSRKEYWQRLFDGMDEIRTRLTKNSRRAIQELMQSQTGIDFNRDNCYAVVLWVVKNANGYFDSQLVDTYELMIDHANVENYVSNQRIFKWNRFTYHSQIEENATRFRLKVGHRMVIHRCGGLETRWGDRKGISERACDFVGDLITVATNLGFNVIDRAPREHEWDDSTARVYRFRNSSGEDESLIRLRAFQNSNLHMQFHPDFIHALNVQHGKLKGWLRNDDEAARELDIPREVAAKHFKPGFHLTGNSFARIAQPVETEGAA